MTHKQVVHWSLPLGALFGHLCRRSTNWDTARKREIVVAKSPCHIDFHRKQRTTRSAFTRLKSSPSHFASLMASMTCAADHVLIVRAPLEACARAGGDLRLNPSRSPQSVPAQPQFANTTTPLLRVCQQPRFCANTACWFGGDFKQRELVVKATLGVSDLQGTRLTWM